MTDRGNIYLDEIHAAILRAGGGEEGAVDRQAAASACIGCAAGLIAIMSRRDRKKMVKFITKTFYALVEDARKDTDNAGMEFENVTSN